MNFNRHEPLDGMVSDLVRRGLPVEYARRAAAEIDDHRRDLAEELRASGGTDSEIADQVSQRLGDNRTLIENTVRAHQRRYWCGRWRLTAFLFAPLPAFIAAYIGTAILMTAGVKILSTLGYVETDQLHVALSDVSLSVKYTVLIWLFIVLPAILTYDLVRLANRAALGWRWIALVACVVGFAMGSVRVERVAPDWSFWVANSNGHLVPKHVDFVIRFPIEPNWWSVAAYRRPPTIVLHACQLLLPMVIAALVTLRARQLALRNSQLAVNSW
jgi:hypothetical protein